METVKQTRLLHGLPRVRVHDAGARGSRGHSDWLCNVCIAVCCTLPSGKGVAICGEGMYVEYMRCTVYVHVYLAVWVMGYVARARWC